MLAIRFRKCSESQQVVLGNFEFPKEFACRCGCGKCDILHELWWACQLIRMEFAAPLMIRSGCRCAAHNQEVGGVADSDHLYGWGADIMIVGETPEMVARYAGELESLVKRIGIYEPGGLNGENGFVHIGVRDRGPGKWKRWRYDSQLNLVEPS